MAPPFTPQTTAGIEVFAEACLALTQVGDGSNPSNPTSHALVVQRPRLRTRHAETWVRVPPGAFVSDCLCGRSRDFPSGHAIRPGVLSSGGSSSLRSRMLSALPAEPANQRVGKPGTPRASGARNRRFKSGHADCFSCKVLCWFRLLTVDPFVRGFASLPRRCNSLLSISSRTPPCRWVKENERNIRGST